MTSKAILPILLIEDNQGDVDIVNLLLKESSIKYKLYHADTLFEGIDIVRNNDIALVLLDLSLPDSSGFKTLSNFQEKVSDVPVVVLTGVNNEIVGNQAVKAGAQDYLVKGQFDGKLLGRTIRYSVQRFKTQLKLKEVAKDLAISEKRYVEAQEMAHFGNWEMDIVSNKMKWTDEVYRMFGFHPGSIQPTLSNYFGYVHLEDKPAVEVFFEQAAKDSQLHKMEHRIVVDGKTIKYVAIQAKVYYEEINGKILLVGTVQDITERKLTEQLILEKNINSQTSQVKEQALADMSFHIRTPLSSIVNLLFLLEKTSISSQQVEFVDGLKTSIDDLHMMINNLLNFSVLASNSIKVEEEECVVRDFFLSIQKVVQLKADHKGASLQIDMDEQLPELMWCDTNKLTQIMYNLLDWVISQASQHSKIGLQIDRPAAAENKNMLAVRIADSATVLSSRQISSLMETEKLLEVYSEEQDDSKRQLGLAIAIKLIKMLGGTIDISSSDGKGTLYHFDVPVKIPQQQNQYADDRPSAPIKILLVEDHFLNQIATKKVLTTWSDLVTVDIAENGLVGVEKFNEHGYDLILMDMQMPVMTGLEASRKIREKSTVPIIALTANASKQEADRCYDVGINEYLAKPFKPKDLYSKIMNLMVLVAD